MNLLSGAPVSLDPNEIRVGTSMDQVLAAAIGDQHGDPEPRARHRAERAAARRRPVDDLRVEPVVGLAHQAARPRRSIPSRVFDRLVGDGTGRTLDRSILDEVRQDSQSLRPQISKDDNVKLERVLRVDPRHREAHRAGVEGGAHRRLAADARRSPTCRVRRTSCRRTCPDHMKLMLDLIVLAFQMDKTRIATLMLNNDLSQMNFKFLEGVQGALHLDLTHNGQRRRQGSDVPEDQSVPHRAVRLPDAAHEGRSRRARRRCSTTRS